MVTKRSVFKTAFTCLLLVVLVASQDPSSKRSASKNFSKNDVAIGMGILQEIGCKRSGLQINSRIFKGRDTNVWKYPWMALLVYSDGVERRLHCGGTLITSQYVLTAAHCLWNPPYTLVSVRLGEYDTAEDPECRSSRGRQICASIQEIDVEETIYHKGFSIHTSSDDIALIRLKEKAIERENVKPIRLPISQKLKAQESNSKTEKIAGWGFLETSLRARNLQAVAIFITHNSACQKMYPIMNITNKQFCAKRSYSCVGDSGGPMFSRVPCGSGYKEFVEFGIISFGSAKCGSIYPTVFTKVSSYIKWIAGNIRP